MLQAMLQVMLQAMTDVAVAWRAIGWLYVDG